MDISSIPTWHITVFRVCYRSMSKVQIITANQFLKHYVKEANIPHTDLCVPWKRHSEDHLQSLFDVPDRSLCEYVYQELVFFSKRWPKSKAAWKSPWKIESSAILNARPEMELFGISVLYNVSLLLLTVWGVLRGICYDSYAAKFNIQSWLADVTEVINVCFLFCSWWDWTIKLFPPDFQDITY